MKKFNEARVNGGSNYDSLKDTRLISELFLYVHQVEKLVRLLFGRGERVPCERAGQACVESFTWLYLCIAELFKLGHIMKVK